MGDPSAVGVARRRLPWLLLCLAMFAAVLLSAVTGPVIPLSFRATGIDPAVASGPLITTLNDVLSLVIYFGVAGLLLRWTG